MMPSCPGAGRAEMLSGRGPFTLSAPTDEVLAAGHDSVGLTPEEPQADPEALAEILRCRASLEAQSAEAVAAREWLPMLNGELASIEIADGAAFIDGAQIILADLEASHGIIHAIDAVMRPPGS